MISLVCVDQFHHRGQEDDSLIVSFFVHRLFRWRIQRVQKILNEWMQDFLDIEINFVIMPIHTAQGFFLTVE